MGLGGVGDGDGLKEVSMSRLISMLSSQNRFTQRDIMVMVIFDLLRRQESAFFLGNSRLLSHRKISRLIPTRIHFMPRLFLSEPLRLLRLFHPEALNGSNNTDKTASPPREYGVPALKTLRMKQSGNRRAKSATQTCRRGSGTVDTA